MANLIVSALATWNGKALNKGKKDISAFDKSVAKLGRTFGATFSAYQILAFSKKAINAFARDEAAAKSLAIQLENTGNAFRIGEVEAYIAGLQKLYGVLDDQLRPAFQTLLNATGSVTLSQKALETALNVSAGTGKDLASVVAAIAKGASGTTTALSRLGTGLDKATIASGDMNKIMAALDTKFKGQALARLDTYAGKMDLIKVATANATEAIGKGLVDALTILSKDDSIASLSSDFENLGNNIAQVIVNLAKLTDKISSVVSSPSFKPALLLVAFATRNPQAVLAALGYVGASGAAELLTKDYGGKTTATNMGGYSGIPFKKAENKAIKDAVTYRKQENAALKAKTAVDALKDKFDVERIGLTAALNSATDDETKLRLRSQLAILDNNEALAKKYLAELNAAQAVNQLAIDAAKAGTMLVDGAAAAFARLALYNPVSAYGPTNMGSTNAMSNVPTAGVSSFVGTPFGQAGGNTGPVNVTLELAPNAGEFGQLIYNSFLINQRDGKSQLYNGGIKGG